MAKINWVKTLGWTEEQLDELRLTGYAYLRQGKYEIALSFYEALAALAPESAYDLQTLGALYLQLNNPLKALKCFDQALKVEADHAPTLLNVAKALFMLGKKTEGLKLAHLLQNEPSLAISNTAKALILAYS
ncbi:tetratricopeptide repeat protein [Parachlamydia sp. AcF125]|uniref:tetratricopeptide repeat protein n=1 Tax=Parachlamydia sp. AcF125 TaxID=2795736 RepID=UPI001BC91F7C|nr:tetratricopeptide repeat protein [Parachlamydia sp. AcF125]MBS4168843.1 hypothetical protein [Parachlamydia sp. AcF125]